MDDQSDPVRAVSTSRSEWIAERRALSRELHDDIAHSVVIMMANLEHIELHQETWDPTAWRLFSDARVIAAATLENIRALAGRLRNREVGGHQDPAPQRAANDVTTELSYVVREAVVNALVHSQARKVVVDVQQNTDRITAVVEDDGGGFEPERLAPHERIGLLSMHERAALVGGRLQIDTVRDGGTRVTISLPHWEASHGGW